MAASVKNTVSAPDESSSSSEDDEAVRRCREAVWKQSPAAGQKDDGASAKESKRIVVKVHEHDGNELQVSQGFRTHVAKKLGHLLDSYISETQTETLANEEPGKCDRFDNEGFRLFSTSVPGRQAEEVEPPAVRRRPLPSSSDSDSEMEMRLKEAAVSIRDLIPSLTVPSSPSPSSPVGKVKGKTDAEKEEEVVHSVKKKKRTKRRRTQEDAVPDECDGSTLAAQNTGEKGEQENTNAGVKQKKKKREKND